MGAGGSKLLLHRERRQARAAILKLRAATFLAQGQGLWEIQRGTRPRTSSQGSLNLVVDSARGG